jgi:carnitine O-acetyltransferase
VLQRGSADPEHLPFVLNDRLMGDVARAESSIQDLADDIELEVLVSKSYGKNFIKTQKFSPDSFVQVSML